MFIDLKEALVAILPEIRTSLMNESQRFATLVQITEILTNESRAGKTISPSIRSLLPAFEQAIHEFNAQLSSKRG